MTSSERVEDLFRLDDYVRLIEAQRDSYFAALKEIAHADLRRCNARWLYNIARSAIGMDEVKGKPFFTSPTPPKVDT